MNRSVIIQDTPKHSDKKILNRSINLTYRCMRMLYACASTYTRVSCMCTVCGFYVQCVCRCMRMCLCLRLCFCLCVCMCMICVCTCGWVFMCICEAGGKEGGEGENEGGLRGRRGKPYHKTIHHNPPQDRTKHHKYSTLQKQQQQKAKAKQQSK